MDCSICYEEISSETEFKTPCNHVFHKVCLSPWLQQKNTCPNCRAQITGVPRPVDVVQAELGAIQAELDRYTVLLNASLLSNNAVNVNNILQALEVLYQQLSNILVRINDRLPVVPHHSEPVGIFFGTRNINAPVETVTFQSMINERNEREINQRNTAPTERIVERRVQNTRPILTGRRFERRSLLDDFVTAMTFRPVGGINFYIRKTRFGAKKQKTTYNMFIKQLESRADYRPLCYDGGRELLFYFLCSIEWILLLDRNRKTVEYPRAHDDGIEERVFNFCVKQMRDSGIIPR